MAEIQHGSGRPRKPADTLTAAQFGRVALILSIYDRVRGSGEKHSEAIEEVVAQLKRKKTQMRISAGTVKRTLAIWRSRDSKAVLIFENNPPNEQDLRHRAWLRQEILNLKSGERSTKVEANSATENGTFLSMRFGLKPIYPRANAKSDR